jgi:hypothetical protein
MNHKDEAGVICVCGLLNRASFNDYEEMTLDIKDTAKLVQALKTFKDNTINIVKEGNMVKILDENGSFDIALAEKILCFREGGIPGLQYDNKILMKKSTVEDIIEKGKIVDSDEVSIVNENKVLTLKIGKESDKAESKMMSTCDKKKESVFDISYFKTLVGNFDTIFDISIGDEGMPSKFEEKTDKYNVVYFITPQTVMEEKKAEDK